MSHAHQPKLWASYGLSSSEPSSPAQNPASYARHMPAMVGTLSIISPRCCDVKFCRDVFYFLVVGICPTVARSSLLFVRATVWMRGALVPCVFTSVMPLQSELLQLSDKLTRGRNRRSADWKKAHCLIPHSLRVNRNPASDCTDGRNEDPDATDSFASVRSFEIAPDKPDEVHDPPRNGHEEHDHNDEVKRHTTFFCLRIYHL
jgi:hypothetical protein